VERAHNYDYDYSALTDKCFDLVKDITYSAV